MTELKECPFCGGKAVLHKPVDKRMEGKGSFVICKECGVSSCNGDYPNAGFPDGEIESWNTRTPTVSVEDLRGVVGGYLKLFKEHGCDHNNQYSTGREAGMRIVVEDLNQLLAKSEGEEG